MNSAYTRIAHRRAIYAELVRLLQEDYLAVADAPAKKMVYCEDVFYKDREVGEEAIHEILGVLLSLEQSEGKELQTFELRRRDLEQILRKAREGIPAEPAASPDKRKRVASK